jgi:hypothetical protein
MNLLINTLGRNTDFSVFYWARFILALSAPLPLPACHSGEEVSPTGCGAIAALWQQSGF